jgi:flagellar biosynthetic protein FlhB
MSESSGEKHFEATPSRIAKAKREGNVPRSTEFSANAAFGAAALAVIAVTPAIGAATRAAIIAASRGSASFANLTLIVAYAIVPIAAAACAATMAGIVQTGGLQIVAVTPKLTRIDPVEGFRRIFSRETVTHTVRGFIAFAVATGALIPAVRDVFAGAAGARGVFAIAAQSWAAAERVVFAAIAIGGCFAILEFSVARRSWLRKLRMTFDEFKRDVKEHDGDPQARARRRALHRSLIRGSLSKVKDASFVVVNPTHVAVALQYRPPDIPVPTVLVRAVEEMALRVRALAVEHGVPVIENVPLARALYRDVDAGRPIPHEHYVAVAEVVAALLRSGALA